MCKRRLVTGEAHHCARQGDRDPRPCIGDRGKPHRVEHVGVALEHLRTLAGGEHAGFFIAVGGLPRGHRATGAGAEITVDQRVVETLPTQRDLQKLALVAIKRALRDQRLLPGFLLHHRRGLGFGFGNGCGFGHGSRLGHRLWLRFGRGLDRCRHRRLGQRIRAHRPELLPVGVGIGDIGIAGDRPLPAQRQQPVGGRRLAVRAERHRIPAACAQPKSVYIWDRLGIAARRLLGLAQGRVRFKLHPVALLGMGKTRRKKAHKNHNR